MESDSHVEVVERSWLLSGQENPALPSEQGGATAQPESIGVTPTGRMIWLNFDAHRHSAEHYMKRYYEHHSRLDLNQPITDLGKPTLSTCVFGIPELIRSRSGSRRGCP